MAKNPTVIRSFPLAHTKKGTITVSHLTEPYGPNSKPVVSIGISLKGDAENPDWKAHIPYENLDDVLEALDEAQERFGGDDEDDDTDDMSDEDDEDEDEDD